MDSTVNYAVKFNRQYKLKPFCSFFVSGFIATCSVVLCKINCIFRGIQYKEFLIYVH